MFYNGTNSTFAIGGGGSNVSGKKLHIDGGTTIGANYDACTVASNGLSVEGNVGIGTTSPTDKFEVHGTSGELFSVTDDFSGVIHSANDITGIPIIQACDSGDVLLSPYRGNVGIGTTAPTEKLDVAGDVKGQIICATANVDTANCFVFDAPTSEYQTNANKIQMHNNHLQVLNM